MTELQWLIKMLTQQKLSSSLKDLFIQRIGEVEAKLNQPIVSVPRGTNITMPHPIVGPSAIAQSPSTQRILEEMENQNPILANNPRITIPPSKIDKETGRAMVQTGKGTSGPRKF